MGHARPRSHSPVALAHALFYPTVRPKPRIIVASGPHPVHHKIKAVAFQVPSFLAASALKPGRCEIVQRGPAGDGPQLMSYVAPADIGAPGGGDAPGAPADGAPGAATPPAGDTSPGGGGSPFDRASAGSVPGPLGLVGPGGTSPVQETSTVPPTSSPPTSSPPGSTPPGSTPPGSTPPGSTPPGSTPPGSTPPTPVSPLTPVSDVPEPGTWSLFMGGALAVGLALRRQRRRPLARPPACDPESNPT